MLTDIYIEALLVDEEMADLVQELWDAGVITDDLATRAWCILATLNEPSFDYEQQRHFLVARPCWSWGRVDAALDGDFRAIQEIAEEVGEQIAQISALSLNSYSITS